MTTTMEEFVLQHLQTTTKTDHIVIHWLKEPFNGHNFVRTYCWSDAHAKGLIEILMGRFAGAEYTSAVIERKIVEGIYIDRLLGEDESVHYYMIALKDHLWSDECSEDEDEKPSMMLEFRHISEMTTTPPSITNPDEVELNTRIERMTVNVRNKFYIQFNKNVKGFYAISAHVTHPQDGSKLCDMLTQITNDLSAV